MHLALVAKLVDLLDDICVNVVVASPVKDLAEPVGSGISKATM